MFTFYVQVTLIVDILQWAQLENRLQFLDLMNVERSEFRRSQRPEPADMIVMVERCLSSSFCFVSCTHCFMKHYQTGLQNSNSLFKDAKHIWFLVAFLLPNYVKILC